MTSIFQVLPQLRTAAPRLSQRLFAVQRCSNALPHHAFPRHNHLRLLPNQHTVRCRVTQTSHPITHRLRHPRYSSSLVSPSIKAEQQTNAWPMKSSKSVALWLLGSAASVFGIVIFGGLTRLTESGLSITEWRPVTGSLPPLNRADWDSEFSKYKSSPEFALLNSSMTLEDFKKIYFMEWTHRLWGRFIGITFLIPTIYFVLRRRVTPSVAIKLGGICGMIGLQGFLGWWMVKSGLKDDLFAPGSHPRVSQYRLTAHLGTAFAVYCSMLYTGLSILKEHRMLADPSTAAKKLEALKHPALRSFRVSIFALTLLVFTTAMSGALVAGLDAGLIYNEFPYMGLGLTPPKKELFDPFYSHTEDQTDLWWRNMLENPSLVQLDHRILATTTFTAIFLVYASTRFRRNVHNRLPKDVSKGVLGLVHLVSLQATLGISTLIYMVPTWLAAAHQAGALALLTGAVLLCSRITMPRQAVLKRIIAAGRMSTPMRPKARLRAVAAHRG